MRRSSSLLLLLTLLSAWTSAADAFRVQVSVPEIIVQPTGAWFNCSARGLDPKESVETIRWFKDDEEFYVYSAVDGRASERTVPGRGITDIDERSRQGDLFLSRTNVNTSGCFKCQVTLTDGRSKEEERRSATIHLPTPGFPLISVGPRSPEDFDTYYPSPIVIASLDQFVRSCPLLA